MAEEKKNWLESTRDYINELKLEMRRVSWPTRAQVESTTAVVIFSVFAFAAYFAVVDKILSSAVLAIIGFFSK
jgi:preprotein translocase subunit SecE